MAKELRPALEWAAVQRCFDDPLFDEQGTVKLLDDVGVPVHGNGLSVEKIQFRLREAGSTFAFNRWREERPSSSQQEEQAQRVALAARLLLESVGSGDAEPTASNIYPFLGPGGLFAAANIRGEDNGAEATIEALRAVWRLRADAEKFSEVAGLRKRMDPPQRGRPKDIAIRRLAADLAELYWYTWLESPGVTINPPGPFMRLFIGVHSALVKRRVDYPRTQEALAKAFQRLDPTERIRFG